MNPKPDAAGGTSRLPTPDLVADRGALDALSDDALVFGPDVARLLSVSLTTFHERRKYREFPIREVTPRLDRRPRFRLGDVRAYVRGECRPAGDRRARLMGAGR